MSVVFCFVMVFDAFVFPLLFVLGVVTVKDEKIHKKKSSSWHDYEY